MTVWKMNLLDRRGNASENEREKFDFCKQNSIVGIGWVGYEDDDRDIDPEDQKAFLNAKSKLEKFSVGDLVWVKVPEINEYYLCKITAPAEKALQEEYHQYDIGYYCKCEYSNCLSEKDLPEGLTAEELKVRSAISGVSEETESKTLDYDAKKSSQESTENTVLPQEAVPEIQNATPQEDVRPTKKKRFKKLIIIASSVLCFVIALLVVLNTVIIPKIPQFKYDRALKLLEEKNYEKSYELFGQILNYKDSQTYYNRFTVSADEEIHKWSGGSSRTIQSTYDDQGNLIKKIVKWKDSDGETKTVTTLYTNSYDTNGNLVKVIEKGDDGEKVLLENTYNTKGKLIKSSDTFSTKTYDSKGRILTSKGDDYSYNYTYDKEGNLIKLHRSYFEGNYDYEDYDKRETVYTYNKEGVLIQERTIVYKDDEYLYSIISTYNEDGDIIYYKNEEFDQVDKYSYEKGAKGTVIQTCNSYREGEWNWSEVTTFDAKKNPLKTIYKEDKYTEIRVWTYDKNGNNIKWEHENKDLEGNYEAQVAELEYDSKGREIKSTVKSSVEGADELAFKNGVYEESTTETQYKGYHITYGAYGHID